MSRGTSGKILLEFPTTWCLISLRCPPSHHHHHQHNYLFADLTGCNWSKRADLCVWRRLQDERRHRRSRLCSCYGLGWGTCQGSLMIINHYWHHCHCKFQHHRVTCDHDLISGSGPHLRQGQRGSPHIQPWHRHRRNCSWGRHPCHWFCTFDIINIIFNLGLGSFSIIDDSPLCICLMAYHEWRQNRSIAVENWKHSIWQVIAAFSEASGKKIPHVIAPRSTFSSNCSSDALEPH